MNDRSNEKLLTPQLSRVRTFLFGALAVVWFGEMMLWGFRPFSEVWTIVQKMVPSEISPLAVALTITHAARAAAKAALGVMAVFGLRSKNPSTRTALFVSMAFVPPLNIAFQFREQGFPSGQTVVAAVLIIILWGSFFLFRERAQQSEQTRITGSGSLHPSRWEMFQQTWFAVNAAVLTFMAFLFLFWPSTALRLIFPYLSNLLNLYEGELSSLIASMLTSGAHLFALATATWIATICFRGNPTLRPAITVASTLHAGLVCVGPLRQMIPEAAASRAASSILILFVPLLVGWALSAAFSYTVELKKQQEAYI
jgi:hypothetical protein